LIPVFCFFLCVRERVRVRVDPNPKQNVCLMCVRPVSGVEKVVA